MLPKSDPQSKYGFQMDPEWGEVRDTLSYGHFTGNQWSVNWFFFDVFASFLNGWGSHKQNLGLPIDCRVRFNVYIFPATFL